MKLLLSALLMLSSFSVLAGGLDYEILDRDCTVEVLQDLYVYSGTSVLEVGSIRLTTLDIDPKKHRRLAAGRILKVSHATQKEIFFDDSAILKICMFSSNNGSCWKVHDMDATDVGSFSSGTLRMECKEKETVDF